MRAVLKKLGCQVIRLSVTEDRVHIFFRHPPGQSVPYIVRRLNGISGRQLMADGEMWAPDSYCQSVGGGFAIIENRVNA
jgi:REP element-mobilizing transposase RayT